MKNANTVAVSAAIVNSRSIEFVVSIHCAGTRAAACKGAELRLCRLFRLFDEVERSRVDAIAQSGWLGTILEDVSEMGAAAAAHDFGALHTPAMVGGFFDMFV